MDTKPHPPFTTPEHYRPNQAKAKSLVNRLQTKWCGAADYPTTGMTTICSSILSIVNGGNTSSTSHSRWRWKIRTNESPKFVPANEIISRQMDPPIGHLGKYIRYKDTSLPEKTYLFSPSTSRRTIIHPSNAAKPPRCHPPSSRTTASIS